jgi:hypothetical protein
VRLELFFQLAFAVGVVAAAASLVAAALGRAPRRLLTGLAALLGLMAVAAWIAFALEAETDLAIAAAGQSLAALAVLGARLLGPAVQRTRSLDAEFAGARGVLHDALQQETRARSAELERTMQRARAESTSALLDEERRLAEEHRRAFAERERKAGTELAEALARTQRRVEQRLAGWTTDLERAQEGFAAELARLGERQRELVASLEARLGSELDRLEETREEQKQAISRVRTELLEAVAEAVAAARSELDAHAVERRRALQEISDRLREREHELGERLEREETEVVRRLDARFVDVERRQGEHLERIVHRSASSYAEEAARQFEQAAKAAREEAVARLGREISRAVERFAGEAHSVLAERMAQVSDSGAMRVEKRLSHISAGLERQRDDFVAALERRLAEAEEDIRERMQRLTATGEAERAVLEARLAELARRVEEVVQQAERRLLAARLEGEQPRV